MTTRTLRSKKLRGILWRAADGVCPGCGTPLGDNWEADHLIPWSRAQQTNVFAMQALCRDCNRKKGAMGLRKHQSEGLAIFQRIRTGALETKFVCFHVTTGAGKGLIPPLEVLQWLVNRPFARSVSP